MDLQYLLNPLTLFVLVWLSIYLIAVFYIFYNRFYILNNWIKKEDKIMKELIRNGTIVDTTASLYSCAQKKELNEYFLKICEEAAKKESTKYLTFLSIISSTAPFIGLFGTVVSILTAFGNMGDNTTLSLVAPAISEALIVTAVGIIVAVPAYSFHLFLSRKAYELMSIIQIQKDYLLSNGRV